MNNMTDKEVKEITKNDENYFYIKVEKQNDFSKVKSVEICSRRKSDKTKVLIKSARNIINEGEKK